MAVLDVGPVGRRRDEPAVLRRPRKRREGRIVSIHVRERGRVRDVPGLGDDRLGGRAREGLDPVGAELLVMGRDRDAEVRAAEERRHVAARDVAGHRIGAHLLCEGLRGGTALRIEHVRPLPAVAVERRHPALGKRNARERMGLVGRLAGARELADHRLEDGQRLDGLRGVDRALPLAVLLLDGDVPAVVLDECRGGVPVLARLVERGEVPVLAELLHQLLAVRQELRIGLGDALDAGLAVHVLSVDHGPRSGVVRHAVHLAAVCTGRLEA